MHVLPAAEITLLMEPLVQRVHVAHGCSSSWFRGGNALGACWFMLCFWWPKVRGGGMMLKPCWGNVERWVMPCGARGGCSFWLCQPVKRHTPFSGEVKAHRVSMSGLCRVFGRHRARGCGAMNST